MAKFMNKLKDILLGVDIDDEDDDEELEDELELDRGGRDNKPNRDRDRTEISSFQSSTSRNNASNPTRPPSPILKYPTPSNNSSNNVVNLHKKTQVNVCLPKNIEESRRVIENTKSQVITIVNLEGVDSVTSQRIADFLSGSVDALDGTIRRLSDQMFIIGPNGVTITGHLDEERINEELRSNGSNLSWSSSVFK